LQSCPHIRCITPPSSHPYNSLVGPTFSSHLFCQLPDLISSCRLYPDIHFLPEASLNPPLRVSCLASLLPGPHGFNLLTAPCWIMCGLPHKFVSSLRTRTGASPTFKKAAQSIFMFPYDHKDHRTLLDSTWEQTQDTWPPPQGIQAGKCGPWLMDGCFTCSLPARFKGNTSLYHR
jgi:hypothetical protein